MVLLVLPRDLNMGVRCLTKSISTVVGISRALTQECKIQSVAAGAGVRGGMDVKSRNIKLKLDRSKDPFPAERSLLLLPFIRAQPPSTSPSGAVMTSLAQVGETGAYCRSTTGIAIESVPINLHILSKRLRELVLAARGLL